MGYKLATAEQVKDFREIANQWLAGTWRFGDCKSQSRYTIMEYLANKEGLTIFDDHIVLTGKSHE